MDIKKIESNNKNISLIAKYLFSMLVVFSLPIVLFVSYNVGVLPLGRLADKINQKNISSIKIGMNRCDVIDILGAPLDSEKSYIISADSKIDPKSIVITYMYSKPGILWDIEIYVNFDRSGKVISVNMQEGDMDFYIYDKDNYYINQKIYNRIIPQ